MGGVASAGKSMAKSVAKPFKRKAAQSAVPAAGGEKGPAGAEPAEPRAVAAGTARAQSTQRGEGEVGHSGPSAATAASLRGQAESKSSKSSKAEERQVQGSSKSSKIRREALRGETPKTLAADKEMVPAFGGETPKTLAADKEMVPAFGGETPKTLAADKEMVPAFGGETPKTLAADKEMVPAFGLSGSETPKTLAADKEMVPAFGAVADTLERLPDGSNTPEQESPMKAGATPKPSTREVPEPWVKVPFEDDFYFWNTQTDETTWDIEDCFASITPREDEAIAPAAHWAAALGLDSGSSEEELGQVASEMREAKAWPSGGTAPLPLVESKPEVPLPPGEWLQREVESEEAPAATEATSHPQPAHPEAPAATEATEATSHPAQSAHPHEAEAEAELWEVTAARLPGAPESPLAERAEQLAAGRLRALVAALEFYDLWKHRKSWTKVVALRAAEALSPSSRSWSPQGAPKQSASPGTSPKRRKNRSVRKKEQETDLKPENNEAPVLHRVAGEAPETALEVLPEVLPKVEVKEVSACLRCGKGISPKGPNAVPGRHARSAVALAPRRKKGLPPKAEKKALAKVYSGPMLPRPMKSRPAWQYP